MLVAQKTHCPRDSCSWITFPLLAGLLLVFCTGGVTFDAGAATKATQSVLIDFSLLDQFDVRHTQTDVAGKVVLLIGSDGDGSEYNDLWGSAINSALAEEARHELLYQLPYADLRSVPFFAKGIARGMMPEAPEEWVLMDWKGSIARAYQFQRGATNVLVFAPDGTLTLKVSGTQPDPETVDKIVSVLRDLLNQATATTPAAISSSHLVPS